MRENKAVAFVAPMTIAAALLLIALAARAQPVSGPCNCTSVTVTSASGQALSAHQRNMLAIDNESTTATIACSFGGTAALNTAGSWTIPPENTRTWLGPKVPSDAVNCISSAATSPASFEE